MSVRCWTPLARTKQPEQANAQQSDRGWLGYYANIVYANCRIAAAEVRRGAVKFSQLKFEGDGA